MTEEAGRRRVLIAVDRSASGRDALALGAVLAEVLAARPVLLAVAEVPEGLVPREDLQAFLDTSTGDLLRGAQDAIGRRAEVRTAATKSPARAIHAAVEELSPSLVVVGSTERGSVGQVLPGSTAAAVLHGAGCAVAVAPRGYADESERHLNRIGVALDGAEESSWALAAAAALAERLHGTLRLLTVCEPFHAAVGGAYPGLSVADYMSSLRREAEDLLSGARDSLPSGLDCEAEVLDGNAAEEIVRASGDLDLLLIGSRGYGLPGRILLGSVSAQVTSGARCPVIVTPRAAGADPLGVG